MDDFLKFLLLSGAISSVKHYRDRDEMMDDLNSRGRDFDDDCDFDDDDDYNYDREDFLDLTDCSKVRYNNRYLDIDYPEEEIDGTWEE